MSEPKKWAKITGLVIHVLIAAMLLFAGSMKLLGKFPPEEVEKLGPIGERLWLIGAGEVMTAILLVFPRTSSLGVLVASGFWGGTICFHMYKADYYWLQSALLILTWIGAYLRIPAMFSSFWGSSAGSPHVTAHTTPAVR
jgi:uncharacterized membrane protein YphA (DoxX/SURF4 family)